VSDPEGGISLKKPPCCCIGISEHTKLAGKHVLSQDMEGPNAQEVDHSPQAFGASRTNRMSSASTKTSVEHWVLISPSNG
jgi:hypothetical protein